MIQLELGQKHAQNTLNRSSNSPVDAQIPKKRGRPHKGSLESRSLILPSQETQMAYDFEGLCQTLDKLDPNTKVKLIIHNFNSYRQFLKVEDNYKNKFVKFVRENRFELVNVISLEKKETKSLKEAFENYAKEKNVDEGIRQIILGEIK
jgi:hypothetical protein